MQGCAFCSKNRNFSYPLISRAPKRSKFWKFLNLQIFRSIWPLTLEVQRVNTSSSELNDSDIVNRQSGGEKLKCTLKFCTEGTCHVLSRMRNDDLALCLWAHDVWGGITRKLLEIETWVHDGYSPIGNDPSRVQWSRDWWRHMTLKGQGHNPNMFDAHYLENGWRYRLCSKGS